MDNLNLGKSPSPKKGSWAIIGIVFSVLILGAVAAFFLLNTNNDDSEDDNKDSSEVDNQRSDLSVDIVEEDMIFETETNSVPDWIKNDPNGDSGPWFQSLYISESEDGLTFTDKKLFLEHAGVANLILTSDNKLIATFQYFSYQNESLFDVIAYSVSDDFGETWSSVKAVDINGLGNNDANPCDPTLVELDNGQFRLYFTSQGRGTEYPQMFSAIGATIDSTFESEGQQLKTDEIVLDPAVIKFNGEWHHYTVKHGKSFDEEPGAQPVGVHSVSANGLNFELEDEIDIDMHMLGDVIEDDGGLRFYNGGQSAFSADGYSWTMDEGERVRGADPGVVKLPSGKYLIIYTADDKM